MTGTTSSPSLPSIARRGEWSIGSVLDVYWHFGSVGNQYLGQILAGHDPNKENFDVLPPHFTMQDPMGNTKVRRSDITTTILNKALTFFVSFFLCR